MTTSSESVAAALRQAEEAVALAKISEDLRPVAFTAAFGMVAGGVVLVDEHRAAPQKAAQPSGSKPPGESALGRLATKLGADEDALSYIYEEDGADFRLIIPRSKLPSAGSRAGAMREVAQLVLAGRYGGEIEDWTSYDRIRQECEELGVLDRGNFATVIQTLDLRYQGGRRSREARLTRHGFDQAATLIREILRELGSSTASG